MKIAIVKLSDLQGNLSAQFHVNRVQGKRPYLKKGYELIPTDNNLNASNIVYLRPEDADRLNELGRSAKQWDALFNGAIDQLEK